MSVVPTRIPEHHRGHIPWRSHPLALQQHHPTNVRCFSKSWNKKKRKRVHSKNKQKRKHDDYDESVDDSYFKRQQKRKQISMNKLHPAAKWKRVLSACDYWWSKGNLKEDEYMRETLLNHAGWMPISTLLTFPKLQHWTNDKILVDAFSSTGGNKYLLSFDERLWNPPGGNNDAREEKKEGMESNNNKGVLLESYKYKVDYDIEEEEEEEEEEEDDDDEKDYFSDSDEFEGVEEEDDFSDSEDLTDFSSIDDYNTDGDPLCYNDLEHSNSYPISAMNSQTSNGNTIGETACKALIPSEDKDTSKGTNILLHENISKSFDESQSSPLRTQNERSNVHDGSQIALQESSDLIPDEDDWSDLSWSDVDDDDAPVSANVGASKFQIIKNNTVPHRGIDELMSDIDRASNGVDDDSDDDLLDDQSEKLASIAEDNIDDDLRDFPRIWQGDRIPYDLSDAFVRRKNVTVATIKAIEEENRANIPDGLDWSEEECMENGQWNPYTWEVEEAIGDVNEEEMQKLMKEELKRKKNSNIKKYSTNRNAIKITHPDQLSVFCHALMKSTNDFASEHTNNPKARAIGFDVEYCSLDYDIRLLPAMIQLSSPEDNDFVGLLWIDKFPNHGRDMLSDKECAPLMSLLSDSSIAKVGVGVSKDAKHLAEWWGVNDPKFVDHFITNVINLENEFDDRVNQKSLKEMAKLVLNRDLPKLKEIGKEAERRKQKMGKRRFTAHWRRPNLTENMINYAASDAACSIDVWLHVNGINSQ
jgi:hypothetical protein